MDKETYIQKFMSKFGYTYKQAEEMYNIQKDIAEHNRMNITFKEAIKMGVEGCIETEKLKKIMEYEIEIMRRDINKSRK